MHAVTTTFSPSDRILGHADDFVESTTKHPMLPTWIENCIEPTEQAAYEYAAKTLRDTIDRLLSLSAERHITPREAATEIATENTERLASEYGREEAKAVG